MFKTISAALIAVSVLAAPAMAGNAKTVHAPAAKSVQIKSSVLNANAKMGRHHHKHFRKHHRAHKHVGALQFNKVSKVTIKQVSPATKRG